MTFTVLRLALPSSRSYHYTRRATKKAYVCSSHLRRFLHSGTLPPTSTVTLGILRETYNSWERRAPLTPRQVKTLLSKNHPTVSESSSNDENHPKIHVQVERCNKRVFSDLCYQEAGAELVDKISNQADIILSVKRPQDAHTLLANKTYAFFSHVVKGQAENMDILRSCLQNHVQLFDYEKILRPDGKRLVSFGRFAGLAGAIDTLHGLGVSFAKQEIWSPFNVFPQTIYKNDLCDAKENVSQLAKAIASDGIQHEEPILFAITGKGGAVHGGVMEILEMLPHDIVLPEELPNLFQQPQGATVQKKVYIVQLSTSDLFARQDGSFDRLDFGQNPDKYHSTFSLKVAPFAKVVVNCAYWDPRFPRIFSKQDAKELCNEKNLRMTLLSDISCDTNGSFEFLEKTTCIEQPFFWYDIQKDLASDNPIPGILCLAVDILPTQLPKDSSEHFGEKLIPVLDEMVTSCTKDDHLSVDTARLSSGVENACITTSTGILSPNYRYLEQFLKPSPSGSSLTEEKHNMTLHIAGHLFDSGLINEIVDAIVDRGGCNMTIEKVSVPESFTTPQKVASDITLRVASDHKETLDMVEKDIRNQISLFGDAEAVLQRGTKKESLNMISPAESKKPSASVTGLDLKKIVCLGSGYVANSAVKFLNKELSAEILVVSNDEEGARRVASKADVSSFRVLNAVDNPDDLSRIIQDADIVLSLLPATMHGRVATHCLRHSTHLVTASYLSDEMRKLGQVAKEKGLIFLNEVGLDPGLDHMSALKIIHSIQARGGQVSKFSSVCGGLPAPQSLKDTDQLKYKFSWSPAGVLRASQQDAVYRLDGIDYFCNGKDLLSEARPFAGPWPELDLEVLPNRNSMKYESIYSLHDCTTMFRGTLRYQGFSMFMNVFSKMGLFSQAEATGKTWNDLLLVFARDKGFVNLWDFLLYCSSGETELAGQAFILMSNLEITGDRRVGKGSIKSAFCKALERKLAYSAGEADMVIMNHCIAASFEDGSEELHQSSMQLFGEENESAMAKTVGYTTGAAVGLVLEGCRDASNIVLLPTEKEVYNDILVRIEKYGIRFEESVTQSPKQEKLTG